jgi:hypothetical protein
MSLDGVRQWGARRGRHRFDHGRLRGRRPPVYRPAIDRDEGRSMNTRIRPAVRWRAGVTSFQMWVQMAMRMLVIAVALWATSAVALVWYWLGRYGRLGCTRVFRSLDTRVGFHPGSSTLVPIAHVSRRTLSRREHVRVSEPELLVRALVRDLVRPLLALGVDSDRSDLARGGKVSFSAPTRRRR